MEQFRIHGDNIVECERIAKLIIGKIKPMETTCKLIAPSTIEYVLNFEYGQKHMTWALILLPGFNKAGRHRWNGNIFDVLKNNGSFLDETPDAIVTKIEGEQERILFAVEFCSALQAGNQAWQRSGRAYSTGRTGCPYIYIVDFVKYELDANTRERKALRFPNAAVPYSYISFTKNTDNFVSQIYVKSEEFDKTYDSSLQNFNEDDFAEEELLLFIFKKMMGENTDLIENSILKKSLNIVYFLSNKANPKKSFVPENWEEIYFGDNDITEYCIDNSTFCFKKTITEKGQHGHTKELLERLQIYGIGMCSRDMPFGIIKKEDRANIASILHRLYPSFDNEIIETIGNSSKDMIMCIMKGFKPRGDDNRPDRGILPLVRMLTNKNVDVISFIYGPMIERNYNLLLTNPYKLASSSGFWRAILSLSDYVLIDSPPVGEMYDDKELLLDNRQLKNEYLQHSKPSELVTPIFDNGVREYHEDDVDTGIHFLFTHILKQISFEGMCNPPGGDWSGFSVIQNAFEYRWLSLPRVSNSIAGRRNINPVVGVLGKRPDHIIEIEGFSDLPLLLIIESKEKSADLELNVGEGLIKYVETLMGYVASVERRISPIGEWHISSKHVAHNDFEKITAAAYLKNTSDNSQVVFERSKCDMLFIMEPDSNGWDIEILTQTNSALRLKHYLINNIHSNDIIKLH